MEVREHNNQVAFYNVIFLSFLHRKSSKHLFNWSKTTDGNEQTKSVQGG